LNVSFRPLVAAKTWCGWTTAGKPLISLDSRMSKSFGGAGDQGLSGCFDGVRRSVRTLKLFPRYSLDRRQTGGPRGLAFAAPAFFRLAFAPLTAQIQTKAE
jgi:hypothetical protein